MAGVPELGVESYRKSVMFWHPSGTQGLANKLVILRGFFICNRATNITVATWSGCRDLKSGVKCVF